MKRFLAIVKSLDDKTYKIFLKDNHHDGYDVVTECEGEIIKEQFVKWNDEDEITLQLTIPIKMVLAGERVEVIKC